MKNESVKLGIYQSLYSLNGGFELIVKELDRLQKAGLLPVKFIRTYSASVEELRARANCKISELLRERELKDWSRFGRLINTGNSRNKAIAVRSRRQT